MMSRTTFLLSSLAVCSAQPRLLGSTPAFMSSNKAAAAPTSFELKSRVYVPYGQGKGFAFGMGAAEKIHYDEVEKYAYAISEQGAVNVVDFSDPAKPLALTNLYIDLSGKKGTDVSLCASKGWLFVGAGASDTVSNGIVRMYSTVKRSNPSAPTMLKEMTVGPLPDMLQPNDDCTKLAVANEGEGDIVSGELVDPQGSVSIITDLDAVSPTVQSVAFSSLGSDEELIAKGVHLPLPLKAMEYWDEHSDVAAELNFASVRANYNSAMNLEPEYLGWSADGKKLYVNLQENSAVVTIDLSGNDPVASRIDAYGLKDWSSTGGTNGIDLVKDSACSLAHYEGWFSMRNPDAIQVINVDGTNYVLTANEGDDKEYGDYEEKWKAKDLLSSEDGSAKPAAMTSTASVVANYLAHNKAGANSKRTITVGSSSVNYSNPAAPVIQKMVGFGGRSVSIYKETNAGFDLLWDSGSQLEKAGCAAFPWAHNGAQDEEFSPVNGVLYNTSGSDMKETLEEMNDPTKDGCKDQGDGTPGACPLKDVVDDRSPKDGPATESIAAGVACGRLLMVTAGEKAGIIFVYDISTIDAPTLLFTKHLSPASRTMSPGLAYAKGTLGEVDPESILFLGEAQSPSGKAGLLIGGAWSGSISWWEFDCPASYTPSTTPTTKDTAVDLAHLGVSMPLPAVWLVFLLLLNYFNQ